MNIKKMGLSIALGLASVGVFAAEEGGFYAGVDANRVRASDVCLANVSCDRTSNGWGVFGGYNINSTFAVEGGYSDLGHFSTGPFDVDVDAWELAGLAKYPVWEGAWSLYARAGWAYSSVDTNFASGDDNSNDYVYGVGAEIPLADKVDMRIDWREYNQVSDTDVSAWSVAGVYKF
jgi:OOP family OmpA-OmpF porin